MTWTEFLEANASRYLEAKQWRDAGLSWGDALATWHKGDDLLWAAEQMGIIDHEAACKIACACVERNVYLAPDVSSVTDAIWQGDPVAAWHEIVATEAITEPEIEYSRDIDEHGNQIQYEPEIDIDPVASKARYAAERLLSGDYPNVLHHAVQVKVQDTRGAWQQAIRDGASVAEVRELESAIERVEIAEHKAQADFVRWLLGGLA